MAWNYDNLMHGLICPVTISLGQVQPFGPRSGELFEAVLSQGVGGGANKKYVLFDFAKYVLFLAQYARWLRTLRLRIFKGKCWNLLESGWRRITYQYLSLNLKVCFKTSNECVYDACTNGFFLQINESLALIIRQLKYSWLPITRTLANSNLALTPTNVDFPWISILHLL